MEPSSATTNVLVAKGDISIATLVDVVAIGGTLYCHNKFWLQNIVSILPH
jgi:hypothetical protein